MILKNKIEKPFGPSATTTGYVLLITGIVYLYFSLVGIILILIGAFLGFTYVCTYLNIEEKRVKFSNELFGLISTGKWIEITDQMSVGIEKSRRGFRTYSRGMRTNNIVVKDVRIILYDASGKKAGPLKKFNTHQSALNEIKDLSRELEISIKS